MRIPLAGMRIAIIGTGLALFMASDALAQVKLEYKFPEGHKLTYKTTSKTSQVLTLMGQAIETESKEAVITSRVVGKARPDGNLPVEEKVESLVVDLALPGGISIAYDSKDPDVKIDNPQLAFLGDIFKVISGIRYTVVLDPMKKVKAVEGTEKFLEQAEKLSEMGKHAIRSRLDADKLKASFEQSHGNLPDVLARTGEPWNRTEVLEIGGGQTLTFKKTYEYLGTEKKGQASLDKIGVKVNEVAYAQDPKAPSPIKATKADLKVDASSGTILFDREAGQIVSAKGKTHIKGPMTFEAGGQEIPGDLDLTIETETELQPAK